jgi:hypothetical protein
MTWDKRRPTLRAAQEAVTHRVRTVSSRDRPRWVDARGLGEGRTWRIEGDEGWPS